MSDIRFPASLKPIVNRGYSQTRGSNVWRSDVQGGVPRQGRDTYYEPVPISVTLVVSSLGRQAFYSFLNNIHGGADSFIMPHDSGLGVQDHLVWITSQISDSTDDGKNWIIGFTATAERTAIQDDTCLTANLPDLFGCYGDCLGEFLRVYGDYQTTFPRIWSADSPPGYPPVNMQAYDYGSRVSYTGPQVSYFNSAGYIVLSSQNEWPLQFPLAAVAGRTPPRAEATNQLKYSRDVSNSAWLKNGVGVTSSSDSFFPSVAAMKITPTTANSVHYFYSSLANTAAVGTLITAYAVVKAAGMFAVQLAFAGGASGVSNQYANFDLASKKTSGDASNIVLSDLGNGWFLCAFTVTNSGNMGLRNFFITPVASVSSGRLPSYAGNNTDGVLVAHAQAEISANYAEPITTTTAAVTRSGAVASINTGDAIGINITYSDNSVVNVPSANGSAPIPQATESWGTKFITRIDFVL